MRNRHAETICMWGAHASQIPDEHGIEWRLRTRDRARGCTAGEHDQACSGTYLRGCRSGLLGLASGILSVLLQQPDALHAAGIAQRLRTCGWRSFSARPDEAICKLYRHYVECAAARWFESWCCRVASMVRVWYEVVYVSNSGNNVLRWTYQPGLHATVGSWLCRIECTPSAWSAHEQRSQLSGTGKAWLEFHAPSEPADNGPLDGFVWSNAVPDVYQSTACLLPSELPWKVLRPALAPAPQCTWILRSRW